MSAQIDSVPIETIGQIKDLIELDDSTFFSQNEKAMYEIQDDGVTCLKVSVGH